MTKTKGRGLGMAIASPIVEAHGGDIAVGASQSGAEFSITLLKLGTTHQEGLLVVVFAPRL